jgi:hypothetical protein
MRSPWGINHEIRDIYPDVSPADFTILWAYGSVPRFEADGMSIDFGRDPDYRIGSVWDYLQYQILLGGSTDHLGYRFVYHGTTLHQSRMAGAPNAPRGETFIGEPEIQEGESLVLLDGGTRYGIDTGKP